jgi:glycosyltransferase involved in cell wall biosynthesis
MAPFFTIITASLNNAVTIGNTLESIKRQSFQNFEHIVCDGGSNDYTHEILDNYNQTYNLKWISESDNGIADALNKGLAIARGRYIIVIQADDRLLNPQILNNVYSLLSSEEADFWSFPIIYNDRNKGKVLKKPIRFLWWNHFKFIFLHQGCFVHRRVFDKIGVFRNEFQIAMDYDFFYRALKQKCSIGFGRFPVAEMGGEGVGSSAAMVAHRLQEEKRVQLSNEENFIWKMFQLIFRFFYLPYKMRRVLY